MNAKRHFLRSTLTTLMLTISIIVWAQPGTSVVEAIKIDNFPHIEVGVNTAVSGIYLGPGTLGGNTCNNFNCCPALVFKVTLPESGSLRIENLKYVHSSGSIIAFTSSVDNPTTWADLVHWDVPGNVCGFRDTLQLGSYSNWKEGIGAPHWETSIESTPIDVDNVNHVAPPGDYYVLIMNYNQYSGTGGIGNDFSFKFTPYNYSLNIFNTEENSGSKIYPNPSNGQVSLDLVNNDNYQIKVYSSLGNLIFNKNYLFTQKIDFSLQVASGAYHVVIISDKYGTQNKTLIIE